MRTDVKLGVVFALVLVLSAGGYFMFRGEKQTPINIAEPKAAAPEIKTTATKPVAPAKAANTQPRPTTTTTSRPGANPASKLAGGTPVNPPARPVSTPVTQPQPSSTPAGGNPSQPLGSATPPTNSLASNPAPVRPMVSVPPPTGPRGADSSPATSTTAGDPSSTSPAASPPTGAPVTAPSLADRPAPASGSEVSLTATAPSSPPAAPASVPSPAMSPLSNSPTPGGNAAPGTASKPTTPAPTMTALPPGIRTSSPPGPRTESAARKSDLAQAAVETHKVQSGDTLSSLAQTYYGDSKYARILADANPKLADPARLQVGTQVSIPPLPADADARISGQGKPAAKMAEKATPATSGKRTYTVKAGDSFYSIAKSQLGSSSRWKELLTLNNSVVHGDPTSLQPGQKLVLPES